jgi:tRNA 5-methylaminomethyl-2-thiouridine biosynthesis bifunctional protein
MRIEPAELAFDGDDTPYSVQYGDVYHSADSGPGQARHVFLGGNDLPRRWARARTFTVLETGFGLGLNFLATLRAWRDDPQRAERLHFVSIEKHPFTREALERIHSRYEELEPLARELRVAWPLLVPGLHRLHFDRVTLTLAFGDAAEVLPKLRVHADAIYLDGFAPQRNPGMWSAPLMKALARLAKPGTTLATYSTAAAVRENLEAAGFVLEKRPGFGRKREMLSGSYAPRWGVHTAQPVPSHERHAIVIGAGVAGAAVCERLQSRGWRIDLVEARAAAPVHAAHEFAGVFHPHVSPDDAIRSRLARSGFLYAIARWLALERAGRALAWERCGVIQVATDREHEARIAEASTALGYPEEYARYVARDEAERLAGCRLRSGGWWFPGGGWMRPASLVAAELATAGSGVRSHFATPVQSIRRDGGGWSAIGTDSKVIATAPVLVLANSDDAQRLAAMGETLARVRGQVTYVPAERTVAPRTVITGRGYVLPPVDGIVIAGSTYDRDETDPLPLVSGHQTNLAHLARLLPDAPSALDSSPLHGAVGFRCAAPDRMPLVGALPDVEAAVGGEADLTGAHLADLPRHAGLYCATGFASRGLVWASLAAETLAGIIEGEPLPLESDLADAVDPSRFVLRRLRRGRL